MKASTPTEGNNRRPLSLTSTKKFFSGADALSERWVDFRLIAAMRLALAASPLVITLIDPSALRRLTSPIFAALTIYTLYSLAIYFLSLRHSPIVTHKITSLGGLILVFVSNCDQQRYQ